MMAQEVLGERPSRCAGPAALAGAVREMRLPSDTRKLAPSHVVRFAQPVDDGRPLRPKLQLAHVGFRYGGVDALNDISATIYANRITAIMGPSGCGKTTLLRLFNRMHEGQAGQVAEGRILLDGQDILRPGADLYDLRRRVGMVFQIPAPFPMSVYDNVAFGMREHEDLSRRQLDGRVEEALRAAALWDEVKDRLRGPAVALSGGQQQRLCIARTLAVKPDVILLDEPCSALDPGSAARIEDTLIGLKRDFTLVLITHNLQQAARISDYAAFMFLGAIVESGPTQEVFLNPRDPRTRDFVTGRFG